ncbi:MAG: diacylglycerol kinase family lipid kinase [Anaerolineae bacterium]|nr:diacylglycerol kinase family lipid kinase [Anaerolineae bacterium]
MPRLRIIFNPAADRGHAAEKEPIIRNALGKAIHAAESEGRSYDLDWVSTEYPEHAIALAHEAAAQQIDLVVAVGGDGTIHEVINGLMAVEGGQRPRLGVIPGGSGNDFAHNFGVPDDIDEVVRVIMEGVERPIDLGMLTDDQGRCVYIDNTMGIGFSGVVNINTRKRKWLRGFFAYLVAVLETIISPPWLAFRLTVDDKEPFTRELCMLSINNGPREAGGFPTGIGALMDDGLLTFLMMRKMGSLRLLRYLPVVMAGKHLNYPKFFTSENAKRLSVETDRPMVIHTDGEVFSTADMGLHALEIEVVPGAVQVMSAN